MYCLRASERIRELQAEGMKISGSWVMRGGKKTKEYKYTLMERPKKTIYEEVFIDGQIMRRAKEVEV